MADIEKVIKGLENCTNEGFCADNHCLYENVDNCVDVLMRDALELLKEQEAIIEQYHKADVFLEAHGWKWEGR